MADEEVTIEKVKSEQERLDANKRKAEEDGAVIELSGDEADAAAVTPAPKKKKKAKRGCGAEKEDCEQHEDCCYPMMCTSPGTTENGDELPLGK